MVIANLKSVIEKSRNLNRDFVRNLLKEELQAYVLNFVYTSPYKDLIFTGGTCLRKFYGLPRISEDLDFDIEGKVFDFDRFQKDLKDYFTKDLSYRNLDLKLKNETVFLRFPVLKEIGFSASEQSDILFLRADFAFNTSSNFGVEKQLFSSYDFSFLAKTYDFPTLAANKIAAFLTRMYKKGGEQTVSFKGRDAFDVVWMLGELKKTNQSVNLKRVYDLTGIEGKDELAKKIISKAEKISEKDLYNDLRSFFANPGFVSDFCQNFKNLLKSNITYL
jgi:predicted nucleotidyltransferase component of viral defense system